ncbi:hypothetical protein BH20ACT13_BH20ACT13_19290 [soil metagenome]
MVAQELNALGEKIRGLEARLADVERVNARLEDAALTTARALGEVSRHWDAVYTPCDARRGWTTGQPSSDLDHASSGLRRQAGAVSLPPER